MNGEQYQKYFLHQVRICKAKQLTLIFSSYFQNYNSTINTAMRTTILLFVLHTVLNSSSVFAQPGTLDSTFSKDGKVFTSIGSYKDGANAVAIQKNGKIVTAGYSEDSTGK